MPDHTPPTWLSKRQDREEPTDAVPVGELSALAAAYERAVEGHLSLIESLEPNRPGTCAPEELLDLRLVIEALKPVTAWGEVVGVLEAFQREIAGLITRDKLLESRPAQSHAGASGTLCGPLDATSPQQDADQAMERARRLPGGRIAYAVSFLPDYPEEALKVLRDCGEQHANTLAYSLLKDWAAEMIQTANGEGLQTPAAQPWEERREDLQCPGD